MDIIQNDPNAIWDRQLEFRTHVESAFQAILKEFGITLGHEIFLVGLEQLQERIVMMPEESGELQKRLDRIDPTEIWNSDYRTGLEAAIQDAVEEVFGQTYMTFVSSAYPINTCLVSMVLLVDLCDYNAQPHLDGGVVYETHGLWPSFLFAVIEEFLRKYSEEMTLPREAGLYALRSRDPRELLRTAGENFASVAFRAGCQDASEDHCRLFNACNAVSSMKYEGAPGIGDFLFSAKDDPAIRVAIRLMTPVNLWKFREYRRVRKLLEMCKTPISLLVADGQIYGLGCFDKASYDKSKENVFVISFVSHHIWELLHVDEPLMRTEYNEPRLPARRFSSTMAEDLRNRLPGIDAGKLESIARKASEAKHGAMLVVTDNAHNEVIRLGRQCFAVTPFPLTEDLVCAVTAIDGAVLIDKTGECHAIGVILDGSATEYGDSSRGARYNSAVRYAEEHGDCVIVVVSEDGMVNIISKRTLS